VTGFDKSQLPYTQWEGWLFTTTQFLHQWTNNPRVYHCQCNGSLVCFFRSLFLGPVWCVWVLKWSSNGSGVAGQHPARNHHTTGQKAWSSNWLLFVISRTQTDLKWDHLAVFNLYVWKTCHFVVPHHPWPLPLCNHLWYWCKTI